MNVVKSSDVTYDCALLTQESLNTISRLLKETSFLSKLKDMGVIIPKLKFQDNMHCTLRYLSGEQNKEKRQYQLSNKELHERGTLCIEGIGAYVKDGVLRNIGLYVNDEKSMNEPAFNEIRDNLFTNIISHITVSINSNRDENGRRLAKAVDTQKCFLKLGGTPQSGEFSYSIGFKSPIILSATAEAISGNQVVDVLSDYPPYREERERVREMDEELDENLKNNTQEYDDLEIGA